MTSIGSMSLLLMRRALRPFGLDLRRMGGAAPWLPANPAMDPVTYLYFVDLRHVPAIRIDIDRARLGVVALPYNMACANPFALAFEAAFGARDEAAARSMVEAILSAYYESVQPADACAALDVTPDEAPGLRDLPAPHWVAPWGTESVEERAWRTRLWAVKDGLSSTRLATAKDGATAFGPVSARKLALEVERTLKLARSIRDKGYRAGAYDAPEVFGLRAGEDYRWFVIRGQHRLAACAAAGIGTVAARVTKIVRREDVGEWPHVVSGTYRVAGALKVFDRLFAGMPPVYAASWVERNRRPASPASAALPGSATDATRTRSLT